jgi:hypothetical protein
VDVPEFWNRCFGLDRDSVKVPEILESEFWLRQKFCGRSRNSGMNVSDHTEILLKFQNFWKRIVVLA